MKDDYIVFDASAKQFILEIFNKTVNQNNIIIDKTTKEEVLSINGDKIALDEFTGIGKGSLLFVKKDLPSIIELSDRLDG